MPYIHAYGVTGVLVEVEVRTDPARDWTAVYAAFDSYAGLAAGLRRWRARPAPAAGLGDEPALVPTLPASVDARPARRYSLRVIAEASTVDQLARGWPRRAASWSRRSPTTWRPTGCRACPTTTRSTSCSGPPRPDLVPHGDRGRACSWDDPDAVRAVYDGPVHLHLELFGRGPGAMVVAELPLGAGVLAGIPSLEAIGVGVHSPHQWYVDRHVDLADRDRAAHRPEGPAQPGQAHRRAAGRHAREHRGALMGLRRPHRPEIAALPPDTVAVLPLGAIEQHGPHLPVSTDYVTATETAAAAVALPCTGTRPSCCCPRSPTRSPTSTTRPGHDLAVVGHADADARRHRPVAGGVGHHAAAVRQRARRQLRARARSRTASCAAGSGCARSSPTPACPSTRAARGSAPSEYGMGVHGGHGETSLMLHLRPELVHMELARPHVPTALREFRHIGFGKPVSFGWTSDDFGPDGHIGDPTGATAEHGKRFVESAVPHLAEVIGEAHRFGT